MALVTQTYKLDLVPDLSRTTIVHCARNDESRHIVFTLYSNGILYTVPSGTKARVEGSKPNGGVFSIDVKTNTNGVEFDLKNTMNDVVGSVSCNVILTDANNREIGTAAFILSVANAGIVADLDLSSTDFSHYIDAVEALSDEAKTYRDEALTASNSSTSSAKAAKDSQNASKTSENNSSKSATAAKNSENASANSAKNAHDWAVGPSNKDSAGTDTNNSEYWASQSKVSADTATNAVKQLEEYSKVITPKFHIDLDTMELIQDNEGQNITFELDENKRLLYTIGATN